MGPLVLRGPLVGRRPERGGGSHSGPPLGWGGSIPLASGGVSRCGLPALVPGGGLRYPFLALPSGARVRSGLKCRPGAGGVRGGPWTAPLGAPADLQTPPLSPRSGLWSREGHVGRGLLRVPLSALLRRAGVGSWGQVQPPLPLPCRRSSCGWGRPPGPGGAEGRACGSSAGVGAGGGGGATPLALGPVWEGGGGEWGGSFGSLAMPPVGQKKKKRGGGRAAWRSQPRGPAIGQGGRALPPPPSTECRILTQSLPGAPHLPAVAARRWPAGGGREGQRSVVSGLRGRFPHVPMFSESTMLGEHTAPAGSMREGHVTTDPRSLTVQMSHAAQDVPITTNMVVYAEDVIQSKTMQGRTMGSADGHGRGHPSGNLWAKDPNTGIWTADGASPSRIPNPMGSGPTGPHSTEERDVRGVYSQPPATGGIRLGGVVAGDVGDAIRIDDLRGIKIPYYDGNLSNLDDFILDWEDFAEEVVGEMRGAPRDKWVCRTFPHRLAQDLKEELRDQIREGLIRTEQACLQWLEDEERVDAPNQKLEDLWSIPLPLNRGELRVREWNRYLRKYRRCLKLVEDWNEAREIGHLLKDVLPGNWKRRVEDEEKKRAKKRVAVRIMAAEDTHAGIMEFFRRNLGEPNRMLGLKNAMYVEVFGDSMGQRLLRLNNVEWRRGEPLRMQVIFARMSLDEIVKYITVELKLNAKNEAHVQDRHGHGQRGHREDRHHREIQEDTANSAEDGSGSGQDHWSREDHEEAHFFAFVAHNVRNHGQDRSRWSQVGPRKNREGPRRIGNPPLSFREYRSQHDGCWVCYGKGNNHAHDHRQCKVYEADKKAYFAAHPEKKPKEQRISDWKAKGGDGGKGQGKGQGKGGGRGYGGGPGQDRRVRSIEEVAEDMLRTLEELKTQQRGGQSPGGSQPEGAAGSQV